MPPLNQQSKLRRLNILILDGGGVRGLSSLLILQELMNRINSCISTSASSEAGQRDLMPHDIFKFVAGTSTGGLIAIMLGKLGMTVDECIQTYHKLSTTIFKKKKFRGRLTHGLMRSKYSGKRFRKCISDLLYERQFSRDLKMTCDNEQDKIACAVVCRELESPSKYSGIKAGAFCICNLPCNTQFLHPVCDAARATSAAPTFFPVVQIGDRCFVDGGMEYNNPSYAIQHHYAQDVRAQSRNPGAAPPLSAPRHGDLNFSLTRYVNIGTGTKTDDTPARRRDALASVLIPSFIRMGIFLKQTLTQVATNSEITAEMMRSLQIISHDEIIYERFSAGHGVCFIKMDSYLELSSIETLTNDYLRETKTQEMLKRVAQDIAFEYLTALGLESTEEHRNTTASPNNVCANTNSILIGSDQPAQSSSSAGLDRPAYTHSSDGLDQPAQPPSESTQVPNPRPDVVTPISTHSSNKCSTKSNSRDHFLSTHTSTVGESMTPLTPPDEDDRKDCSPSISDSPTPLSRIRPPAS